jgi:hypothetical protein
VVLASVPWPGDALPDHLAARILAAAPAALAAASAPAALAAPAAPAAAATAAGALPVDSPGAAIPGRAAGAPITPIRPPDTTGAGSASSPAQRRSRAPLYSGIAMAASVAIAAGAVLWARTRAPEVITKVVVEPAPVQVPPTPAEARAQLLSRAKDVATLAWTATGDPAAKGASGDVVWSPGEQRGFMRFVGLTPNDPQVAQYQLWIFDRVRDDKFPVDGGVFDVSASGEVIVPITSKLGVSDATLFAITVEKPGGVVVSKRERIVLTAAPAKG